MAKGKKDKTDRKKPERIHIVAGTRFPLTRIGNAMKLKKNKITSKNRFK